MKTSIIVDTGPLVAYFDRDAAEHDWVRSQAGRLAPGWLTSEAVLGETVHLLRRARIAADEVLELVEKRLILVPFQLEEEVGALRRLLRRYRNVPMSLADASLVRLSELYEESLVFTLDSDFSIYRRFDRRPISVLMPEKG
ncbi:MAG: type II toxin-antitoxin system VapC family toxin [Limisphaerales bacterium]